MAHAEDPTSCATALACAECGERQPLEPVAACPKCWGALQPVYDLDRARRTFTRARVGERPRDIWRYRELLPATRAASVQGVGFTPLLPAPRLAARLGIADLWIKYDAACHPTLSFKDRLVAVALAKALELGMHTVGCSSTGNLAHATAAAAAVAGRPALVLLPETVDAAKLAAAAACGATLVGVRGHYDRANRLATEVADRHDWGMLNVNLRAYYAEGGKTVGYEIAEQRGWSLPGHVVVPMAGGGLLTKIDRAWRELSTLGLVADEPFAIHGVQPAGCNPIVDAFQSGRDELRPVRPDTRVHSLAVGDPADGLAALRAIRRSGGRAEDPSDDESLEGVRLLATTEGLLAETAGGTVVAAARRLAEAGTFRDGHSVVLVITGHGLKTVDVLGAPPLAARIDGRLDEFETFWSARESALGR